MALGAGAAALAFLLAAFLPRHRPASTAATPAEPVGRAGRLKRCRGGGAGTVQGNRAGKTRERAGAGRDLLP